MPTFAPDRFVTAPAMLMAGRRRRHTFAEAAAEIPRQWAEFSARGTVPRQVGRTAYGVMCSSDVAGQSFEYLCGVEVSSFEELAADLDRIRVPAGEYAVFEHRGHVSTLHRTWDRLWREWLPTSGVAPAATPDFERYDAGFDPVTGLGGMAIWFPVQRGAVPTR